MAPLARLFVALALCVAASARGTIVISQIYGGGGNSGATYRNDFIELFNRGTNEVSVNDWSVQYASGSGISWQMTPISGTIAPGRYYLVQQAAGSGGTTALPAPDAAGGVPMSASLGKIALVSSSVALAGTCPSSSSIVDLVGYGSGVSCAEISPTLAHSSTTSLRRLFDGCTDTQDNVADFFEGAVLPRNSSSALHRCDVAPRVYAIHEIQGTNSLSPFVDQFVTTTTNVVTAVRNNGFFMQTFSAEEDSQPLSSQGLSVLSGGATVVNVGDAVVVSGSVMEFRPAADPLSPTRTQIGAESVTIVSRSNGLPPAVAIGAQDLGPAGGLHQLERFEGMRVHFETLLATAPTEGFLDEANALATSTGVFYGVPLGATRPFREPGLGIMEQVPASAPCCVPRFDENPELLRVDSNGQLGVSVLNVNTGTVISNLTGVLFYEARRYTVLPDPAAALISPPPRPQQVPARATDELTIATLNLERFYDDVDDTNLGDVVLSTGAFSNRLHKAALLIGDQLRMPDVVGLAEIENIAVLERLAQVTSSDYSPYLFEGADPGGIDVGFLVNTTRVSVTEVRQEGRTNSFLHAGVNQRVHDRPPLLLRTRVPDPFSTNVLDLTVIMNHLRSMIGIEDAANADFIRAKRRAQAQHLAQLVQKLQTAGESVIVMGDFNAFEFNDGYADVMGTIIGRPAPTNQVLLSTADVVDPDLLNLLETLPPIERYSYIFDGVPQAIDHILVTRNLRHRVTRFLYPRINADFAEVYRNIVDRPERISDHDPAMAYIRVGVIPRITSLNRTSTEVMVEGEGLFGRVYDVERSQDLSAWQKIGSAVPDQAQRFSFRDFNPVSGAAFYRLRATDQN